MMLYTAMRVEPYGVDSILHVVKRGARGNLIVQDELDKKRFARLLYHLNDEFRSDFWESDTALLGHFERPKTWPKREPLVDILAWTLMPNHFHLLLKEIKEGGVSRFMQSLGGSMSRHFNEKYSETGSLFQGSFHSSTVDTDEYLRYVCAYIMGKNVFELYPGGLIKAGKEFDSAWDWAKREYQYSSLPVYAGRQNSLIVNSDALRQVFHSTNEFRFLQKT